MRHAELGTVHRREPLVQAVCEPFDPSWLAGFGPHRAALLAWTLDYTNRFGLPTFDMYPWVRKHVAELDTDAPEIRLLLAEAALLRGDSECVEAQLRVPGLARSSVADALVASLALLRVTMLRPSMASRRPRV